MLNDYTPKLTPVEETDGGLWLKRDDLYCIAGSRGGKVRSCWKLCQGVTTGLVTASHRPSPQGEIVSGIAKRLGIPCRVHTPKGEWTVQMHHAKENGAEIFQHAMGYNNVISKRAIDDAEKLGWKYVPFGMECPEALDSTSDQVRNLPDESRRLVVPVGSGISLSGILRGLDKFRNPIPVIGVMVGADRRKKLDQYAPKRWPEMVELVNAGCDYHHFVHERLGDVILDPVYEAKCVKFLRPGDVFWIVGIRQGWEGSFQAPLGPTIRKELELTDDDEFPLVGRRR